MCDVCLAKDDKPPREDSHTKAVAQRRLDRRTTVEQVIYGDRSQLALAMRIDYATWTEIAQRCGYTSERTAFLAVRALMQKRQAELDESIDHVRARELERLERMAAAAQKVLDTPHYLTSAGRVVHHGPEGEEQPLMDDGPVLQAIDRLVKVSESRRRLLGLDAPEKVQNDVRVRYTVQGVSEEDMP